jgi:hypothetical protein
MERPENSHLTASSRCSHASASDQRLYVVLKITCYPTSLAKNCFFQIKNLHAYGLALLIITKYLCSLFVMAGLLPW